MRTIQSTPPYLPLINSPTTTPQEYLQVPSSVCSVNSEESEIMYYADTSAMKLDHEAQQLLKCIEQRPLYDSSPRDEIELKEYKLATTDTQLYTTSDNLLSACLAKNKLSTQGFGKKITFDGTNPCYSPNNSTLCTTSQTNKHTYIYSSNNLDEKNILTGSEPSFSPHGNFVQTKTDNNTYTLYSTESASLAIPTVIYYSALSPNEKYIIIKRSSQSKPELYKQHTHTTHKTKYFEPVTLFNNNSSVYDFNHALFSPNSDYCMLFSPDKNYSHMYETQTGKFVAKFVGTSPAFSPLGSYILTHDNASDSTFIYSYYNYDDTCNNPIDIVSGSHACWSPTGTHFITEHSYGLDEKNKSISPTTWLYFIKKYEKSDIYPEDESYQKSGHFTERDAYTITQVAQIPGAGPGFSYDGSRIITHTYGPAINFDMSFDAIPLLYLVDTDSGAYVEQIPKEVSPLFSKNAHLFITQSSESESSVLRSTQTGDILMTMTGTNGQLSPDNSIIMTLKKNMTYVYSCSSGSLIACLDGYSPCISHDNSSIITAINGAQSCMYTQLSTRQLLFLHAVNRLEKECIQKNNFQNRLLLFLAQLTSNKNKKESPDQVYTKMLLAHPVLVTFLPDEQKSLTLRLSMLLNNL